MRILNVSSAAQVLKLLNIPVICVMEFFWLGIWYTPRVQAALLLILAGVALATVTDVSLSWPGLVHGALATVATGVYQILAGTKQKQYEVNAMQLMHYQVHNAPQKPWLGGRATAGLKGSFPCSQRE